MSKIQFNTYTPEQIADNLKTLPNDQLIEVVKRLAKEQVGKGKNLMQVFSEEAEQKSAGEHSELTRLQQLKINQDWLIQRTDGRPSAPRTRLTIRCRVTSSWHQAQAKWPSSWSRCRARSIRPSGAQPVLAFIRTPPALLGAIFTGPHAGR
jgi:hypothetical protein